MDPEDDLLRENQVLRERLSRLSEASLRINESLDLDTVLRRVRDATRVMCRSLTLTRLASGTKGSLMIPWDGLTGETGRKAQ